jgi:hypothetical protein
MADHLSGWEVISKKRDKSSVGILFRDMLLFLFGWGTPHNPPVKFTVREKSTGYIKTVTAYDESELPERIAKGQFDFDRIISEDAAELILAGIRRGGEARALAFDNIVRIGAAAAETAAAKIATLRRRAIWHRQRRYRLQSRPWFGNPD